MTRIIVDTTLGSKLQPLAEVVELCDESGQILGRFIPAVDLSQYGPLEPQISDAELERRSKSNEPRYTTAQVLAYLEKL